MADKTNIGWCDGTWNVARGCQKVSEGCKFCYMMRNTLNDTRHLSTTVVQTKRAFTMPLRYKQTSSECWPGEPLIFTSSLTDLFHTDIDSYRHEVYAIIRKRPDLRFLMLTKRIERVAGQLPPDWPGAYPNVWLGTTVENQARADERIDVLLAIDAPIHYLSVEPLLEPIDLTPWLDRLDWVILGGETGFGKVPSDPTVKWGYRASELDWYVSLVEQCQRAGVPVFVKQLGTHLAKTLHLRNRSGEDISEFPPILQRREFPPYRPLTGQ